MKFPRLQRAQLLHRLMDCRPVHRELIKPGCSEQSVTPGPTDDKQAVFEGGAYKMEEEYRTMAEDRPATCSFSTSTTSFEAPSVLDHSFVDKPFGHVEQHVRGAAAAAAAAAT